MVQKHYYFFGDEMQKKMKGNELNEENWNILRNDEVDGLFSIEKDIEAYEANCKKSTSYEAAAKIIVHELEKYESIPRIISLGVGKGILEWHLKNINPSLRVECTDYTAEAIERLKTVFVFMDAGYTFNMLCGDYSTLDIDSILVMYRVSTEFDRGQWHHIFKKVYDAGVKTVIYVPAGLDTEKEMLKEEMRHLRRAENGQEDFFLRLALLGR